MNTQKNHQWMTPLDLLALARREPVPASFDAHELITKLEQQASHQFHFLQLLRSERLLLTGRDLDAFDSVLDLRGLTLDDALESSLIH